MLFFKIDDRRAVGQTSIELQLSSLQASFFYIFFLLACNTAFIYVFKDSNWLLAFLIVSFIFIFASIIKVLASALSIHV